MKPKSAQRIRTKLFKIRDQIEKLEDLYAKLTENDPVKHCGPFDPGEQISEAGLLLQGACRNLEEEIWVEEGGEPIKLPGLRKEDCTG